MAEGRSLLGQIVPAPVRLGLAEAVPGRESKRVGGEGTQVSQLEVLRDRWLCVQGFDRGFVRSVQYGAGRVPQVFDAILDLEIKSCVIRVGERKSSELGNTFFNQEIILSL